MHDESEDLRWVGRDEMNLAEFPITLLAERVPEGCKTLVFEDKHGKLTISGSDVFGLPTAPDTDVIVALLHMTKAQNGFTNPTVSFRRYELLKLLGWPDDGRHYRRLDESLNRWVGATLYYDGCWWDNKVKCRVDAKFHIIDRVRSYAVDGLCPLGAKRDGYARQPECLIDSLSGPSSTVHLTTNCVTPKGGHLRSGSPPQVAGKAADPPALVLHLG